MRSRRARPRPQLQARTLTETSEPTWKSLPAVVRPASDRKVPHDSRPPRRECVRSDKRLGKATAHRAAPSGSRPYWNIRAGRHIALALNGVASDGDCWGARGELALPSNQTTGPIWARLRGAVSH